MDKMDDHRSPDPGQANGTNGAAALDSIAPVETGVDMEGAETLSARQAQAPAFLSELAHAMQAAADRERERIASVVAEDARTHVEKVRSRAEIEAGELRRLAEEDVRRIEEWSASEIERVRGEAAQKTSDRRASLAEYLVQHDAIVASEIDGVDGAVADYGKTLETFFLGLSDSNDPSEIVRRAERLPAPPDLDTLRATARAEAVARLASPTGPESPATDVVTVDHADASDTTEAAMVETEGADVAPTSDQVEASSEPSDQPSSEDGTKPVGVMDPSAAAVPGWPADDHLAIGQPADHASAAVRLLRSVAPWTAPVHAGEPERPADPD